MSPTIGCHIFCFTFSPSLYQSCLEGLTHWSLTGSTVTDEDTLMGFSDGLSQSGIKPFSTPYYCKHQEATQSSQLVSVSAIKCSAIYHSPVVSAEVEMTAYSLLTYTLLGDVASALPVVKWLSQQRNSLGGFSSTQVKI